MSNRKVNLVIVCEDDQQGTFARQFFQKRGMESRKIRVEKSPKGKGAGEHFVKKKAVTEIKTYRQKSSYGHGGLAVAVIIDADNLSVQERYDEIQAELDRNELKPIQPDEKIAVFIPKRNIETWIHFAKDKSTNETTGYPKSKKPKSCKEEGDLFVNEICRQGVPDTALPSIIHACNELTKILR